MALHESKAGTLLGGRLVVMQADITTCSVDAIVNAANSTLMGGGGVDGAIHRAGGPSILEECRRIRSDTYPDGLPTGGAVVTGAGALSAQYVIHTVGPIWRGGTSGEAGQLASCYTRCLEEAMRLDCCSVAFPAISTGVYGYPGGAAAQVAFKSIEGFVRAHCRPDHVYCVFFSKPDMQTFLDHVR